MDQELKPLPVVDLFPSPFKTNRTGFAQVNGNKVEYKIDTPTNKISLEGSGAFFILQRLETCIDSIYKDEPSPGSVPLMGVFITLEFYLKECNREIRRQRLEFNVPVYLSNRRYSLAQINFTKLLGFNRKVKNLVVGFEVIEVVDQCNNILTDRGDLNIRLDWVKHSNDYCQQCI